MAQNCSTSIVEKEIVELQLESNVTRSRQNSSEVKVLFIIQASNKNVINVLYCNMRRPFEEGSPFLFGKKADETPKGRCVY